MSDYIDEVFGAGGLLARKFPGYEQRPGQVALARAVEEALRDGRHCLAEGPTGTGKGFAYLVPAVEQAIERGQRTVVVTANIALQEQLVQKDLPLLRALLPKPFDFALLKGRSNFLCHDRLNKVERELAERDALARSLGGEGETGVEALVEWAHQTRTGDVSELSFVPEARLWSRFSVSSDECKGGACRFIRECLPEAAKRRAADARIVVTNYSMLFADLIVRATTEGGSVLGDYSFLVLDEAHAAADIARDTFGFELALGGFRRHTSRLRSLGCGQGLERLEVLAERFFGAVVAHARTPEEYSVRLRANFGHICGDDGHRLALELGKLASWSSRIADADGMPEERAEARSVTRSLRLARSRVLEALEPHEHPETVYWVEAGERPKICARLIDVADKLRAELFNATRAVVMTSATLAIDGSFDFVKRELGVPGEMQISKLQVQLDLVPDGERLAEAEEGPIELVAPTPFDFERQALLVIPRGLPEPAVAAFPEAAAATTFEIARLVGGRTLGLFTSRRNLDVAARYFRSRDCPWRVLVQGDMPRLALARAFREDATSVLLATQSFWTGLDVPGDALEAVVVDKLPFPTPVDPLIAALSDRAGRRAFDEVFIPRAVTELRQGVGRLIRSRADIGVVALLDRRLIDKGYGRTFLRSLPPMRVTRDLGDIPDFLAQARGARGAA